MSLINKSKKFSPDTTGKRVIQLSLTFLFALTVLISDMGIMSDALGKKRGYS